MIITKVMIKPDKDGTYIVRGKEETREGFGSFDGYYNKERRNKL